LLSLEYNIVVWDKKGSEGTLACLPLLNLDVFVVIILAVFVQENANNLNCF